MSTKHLLGVPLALFLAAGGASAEAPKTTAPAAAAAAPTHQHGGAHVMIMPADLKWGDAPPGLPKGAKVAVLEGDPSKPGPFTLRGEFPANYKIPPHWHPAIEHLTVLSGEFYMGAGKAFNEGAATKLGVGGFAIMPEKFEHYAFTKGQKAIVQLHGIGPWGITYLNPADDPRNAPPAK